jgi:hypothetical protein
MPRPLPRWLGQQTERFRSTLTELVGRLREDLTRTLAVVIGEAVREGLRVLSGGKERTPGPTQQPGRRWGDEGPASPWRSNTGARNWDDESRPWGTDRPHDHEDDAADRSSWLDDEEADEPIADPPVPAPEEAPASRWRQAVTLGGRAAAWWLGRSSRRPLLGAAVIALVASLGTVFLGPSLVAGMTGVGLGLMTLLDGLASTSQALMI